MIEQRCQPTAVIFRRWRRDPYGLIAIFPEIDGGSGHCMMYEQIAHYSAGSYATIFDQTTSTAWDDPDVIELQAELEQIGYRLRPRQRAHWSILCTRR